MNSLLGTDWRSAWIEYNLARKAPDDAEFWDGRAKSFNYYAGHSPYTEAFIKYLDIAPSSTLLDMGCGSGTLAIPLARAGHNVVAVDFSSGMLAELRQSIADEDLNTICTRQLDFNAPWEDWEAKGITANSVDIALASRSTMVNDLWGAFEKLERAARVKVAVTMATSFGPRSTKRLENQTLRKERDTHPISDYVFAVNILFQMGRFPTLRFINADKINSDGALQKVVWAFICWDLGQNRNP